MVRLLTENALPAVMSHPDLQGKRYIEAVGLSTDTKPTEDVLTGSTFMEVNTGKVFFFDESSNTWLEAGGANA
jgi:hypothetical protein